MAVNKVTLGDETLIDLTNDTAEPEDVLEGAYFHTAAGVRTAGTRRNIDVDDELSPTSENPVQNKVITQELSDQKSAIEALEDLTDRKAGMLVDSVSGAIASFVPDSTIDNLLDVTVNIEPVQAGSGDPSPENVRPISGWDAVAINHSGVDMTDPTTYTIQLGQTVYGGTVDLASGVLLVNKRYMELNGGVSLYGNYGIDNAPLFYVNIPRGVAIKQAASSLDTSKLISNYFSPCSDLELSMKNGEIRTNVSPNPTRIYFRWDSAATTENINAAFARNHLQVIADLATTITVQLDPVIISALADQTNNVWADAGDVSVTYAADLKHYIDSKIAALAAQIVNS